MLCPRGEGQLTEVLGWNVCLMSLEVGKKSKAVCSWWEKGIRKRMFLVGAWELKEEWTTVCSGWKNWGKRRSWKREILNMWHGRRKEVTEREVMESRCLHVEDIGEIPIWRVKEMQGSRVRRRMIHGSKKPTWDDRCSPTGAWRIT